MKEEFEANSCRVCLTKTKKLRSLYRPVDEGDEPPNEMLLKITGIQVEKLNESTMLPKNICKNCELSLSMAFEFRANALKTQQMIVSYLKELIEPETVLENTKTIAKLQIKRELVIDKMDVETIEPIDDNLTACNMQNINSAYGQSVPIKNKQIIHVEDDMLQDEAYANVALNETQQYTEENTEFVLAQNEKHESSYEINENYSDPDDNEDESNEDEERIDEEDEEEDGQEEIELEEQKEVKVEDSKLDIKIITPPCQKQLLKVEILEKHEEIKIKQENMKQIPRRGRKPMNSSNNLEYICDVCGNVYAKRSRMMEHRQRHDKELKYACELCDKKFHMRELLRKHMYSHSGGKPLKCEFCSRTFYYESVRKAHEAVHQGVKPYVCEVCGKAFGYAHALKKHTLIHAEIKLYRCDYCNKDFRLQHHMKQHELTRMHKNIVRVAEAGGIPDVNSGGGEDNDDADDKPHNEENLTDDILVEEIIDEPYYNS